MSNIFTMCFVQNKNQLLLQKRVKKPFKGLWDAPGGKVSAYESPVKACKREIHEETGLEIDNVSFRGIINVTNEKQKRSNVLMLFHTKDFSGCLCASDESEIAWVETEKIYSFDITTESFTYLLPYILETDNALTGKIIYSKKKLELFEINL